MTTVLHVTRSAWFGGGERTVLELAAAARARGWRSLVAYWKREPPQGVEVEYVLLPSGAHRWPAALARLVRSVRPDLVHLHMPSAGSLGALSVRATGMRRIVYTEPGIHASGPLKVRIARRLAARVPVANVAVSEAVARSLIADGGVPARRVSVIRSGTAVAPPMAPPEPHGPPRLLCVGNLWPWKGHRVLLRALQRLDGVRLLICGDGPERARIEREAAALGVTDRVELPGYLDDPWTAAAGTWVFVHPSFHEGLPRAVREAMMRALPVVASWGGGTAEIVVDGDTGLLVPPGDSTALASAIGRLLSDRELRDRLAWAARSFALVHLRVEDMIEAYFRLYDRVLGAPG